MTYKLGTVIHYEHNGGKKEGKHMELNYFTLEDGHKIRLHGFQEIHTELFVSILETKHTLTIGSRKTKRTCLTVQVLPDRTIQDESFYFMLYRFKLFNTRFVLNSPLKNYFATDMSIT